MYLIDYCFACGRLKDEYCSIFAMNYEMQMRRCMGMMILTMMPSRGIKMTAEENVSPLSSSVSLLLSPYVSFKDSSPPDGVNVPLQCEHHEVLNPTSDFLADVPHPQWKD